MQIGAFAFFWFFFDDEAHHSASADSIAKRCPKLRDVMEDDVAQPNPDTPSIVNLFLIYSPLHLSGAYGSIILMLSWTWTTKGVEVCLFGSPNLIWFAARGRMRFNQLAKPAERMTARVREPAEDNGIINAWRMNGKAE
jgi:hypothetical protein